MNMENIRIEDLKDYSKEYLIQQVVKLTIEKHRGISEDEMINKECMQFLNEQKVLSENL